MAPQPCQVCNHKKRKAIDRQIAEGVPHVRIAKQYSGLDNQNIRRHAINHLPKQIVKAIHEKNLTHSTGILEGIQNLLERTERIMQDAEDKQYGRLELEAINSAKGTYELLSKIAVKLKEYQQGDYQQEKQQAEQQAMEQLENLSVDELKIVEYLQIKTEVFANNGHGTDSSTVVHRYIEKYGIDPVDWPKLRFLFEGDEDKEQEVTYINKKQSDNTDSSNPKRRRTRLRQQKSNKMDGDAPRQDDSDDFDLELDDLNDLDDLSFDDTVPEEVEKERGNQWRGAFRPNFD